MLCELARNVFVPNGIYFTRGRSFLLIAMSFFSHGWSLLLTVIWFGLFSGTKIQPKEEVFGRTSLRTSGQKLRSGPPNPGKNKHFGTDIPRGRP